MEKVQKKRSIIISIYSVLFIMLIFGMYSFFKTPETCSDGIENQNEEDIDCGGVCAKCTKIKAQNLTMGETGVLGSSIFGEYDFYGLVKNPNNIYGGKYFEYQIKLLDETGNVLVEKKGNSYILPGDEKYIAETNLKSEKHPASVEFSVSNEQWVAFDDYYEKPDIRVVNKNYTEITSGIGFAEARGLVKNESAFDFTSIKIKVLLRDDKGNILAINSTAMNTVKSGEEREFKAAWPSRFQGEVRDMETQVEVNVFSSDAFAKKYFKPQQFQQY